MLLGGVYIGIWGICIFCIGSVIIIIVELFGFSWVLKFRFWYIVNMVLFLCSIWFLMMFRFSYWVYLIMIVISC